ncbi:MAG TPA: dienelactone hydrolase family protein [Anaeromyxobacter sp.]|nr:dienelactone hydrolase family protein [Anaeromyxobacter sp.]
MELSVTTADLPGPRPGHLVRPAREKGPLPGVILIQEIWGVDGHIQDVSARLATAGYAVLAPALFARGGSIPPALSPDRVERVKRFLDTIPPQAWAGLPDAARRAELLQPLAERERAPLDETLAAIFPPDRGPQLAGWTRDLAAIARWLRLSPHCQGRRVGAVGFCMGGALAAQLAAEDPELAAAVVFYGAPPPADRLPRIACPVQAHFGAEDPRLVAQLPAFEQGMRAAGKALELFVYPGAPHAFFNDTRRSFHLEASRQAWARTLGFLSDRLGPG